MAAPPEAQDTVAVSVAEGPEEAPPLVTETQDDQAVAVALASTSAPTVGSLENEVDALRLDGPADEVLDTGSQRDETDVEGKLPVVAEEDEPGSESPATDGADASTPIEAAAALASVPAAAPTPPRPQRYEDLPEQAVLLGESSTSQTPATTKKKKKKAMTSGWAAFFAGSNPTPARPSVGQRATGYTISGQPGAGPSTSADSRSPPPTSDPLPWEIDPERPAQKLPVRFKDALGRSYLVPWRTARTWDGMKALIDNRFSGTEDSLRTAVSLGRFDVTITPAPPTDPQLFVQRPPSVPSHHRPRRTFDVVPESWDELIQPGAFAQMNMWPRQPSQPVWHWPPGTAAMPPGMGPPGMRPRVVNVLPPSGPTESSRGSRNKKGKTMKNTGRPVRVRSSSRNLVV